MSKATYIARSLAFEVGQGLTGDAGNSWAVDQLSNLVQWFLDETAYSASTVGGLPVLEPKRQARLHSQEGNGAIRLMGRMTTALELDFCKSRHIRFAAGSMWRPLRVQKV